MVVRRSSIWANERRCGIAYNNRGDAMPKRDYDRAVQDFEHRSSSIQPTPSPSINSGVAYLKKGELDVAITKILMSRSG